MTIYRKCTKKCTFFIFFEKKCLYFKNNAYICSTKTDEKSLTLKTTNTMKQIITSNNELLEVLAENGINIICDDQMRMTLSDEDADRVDKVIEVFAPAAYCDYTIYDIAA